MAIDTTKIFQRANRKRRRNDGSNPYQRAVAEFIKVNGPGKSEGKGGERGKSKDKPRLRARLSLFPSLMTPPVFVERSYQIYAKSNDGFVTLREKKFELVAKDGFAVPAGTGGHVHTFSVAPIEGDLVLIMRAHNNSITGAPILTSGYSTIHYPAESNPGVALQWKIMGSTPDVSINVDEHTTKNTAAVLYIWRHVDASTPIDNTYNRTSSSGTAGNPPSHTTLTALAMRMVTTHLNADNSTSSAPAGFSNYKGQQAGGPANLSASMFVASAFAEAAGALDPGVFGTHSSDSWRAYHFALRPISGSPQYAAVAAAAANSGDVDIFSTTAVLGQQKLEVDTANLQPEWQASQAFMEFDMSVISAGETVTSAVLKLFVDTNSNGGADHVSEVRPFDWGGTLDVADARSDAELAALTLLGTLATSGITTGQYNDYSDVAMKDECDKKSATMRIVIASDRNRLATAPTADEFFTAFTQAAASDPMDPYIEITTLGLE